jgi:uncharacterized protein YukJ
MASLPQSTDAGGSISAALGQVHVEGSFMAVKDYGVVAGTPLSGKLVFPSSGKPPHYKITVQGGEQVYEVAVNVQSVDHSQILYHIDFAFQPPDAAQLQALTPGRILLPRKPGGLAVDFLRQGVVNKNEMRLLPLSTHGQRTQLLGLIQSVTAAASQDPDAVLFAFGSEYTDGGPQGVHGIHDIHMNQGNPGHTSFAADNAIWQDGAIYLYLPSQNNWIGVFLAFQTQLWTTDANGAPSSTLATG